MAKAPIAGRVKTRLVPFLSPEEAAELSRALVLDLLEALSAFKEADLAIAFSPQDAGPWFKETAPPGFSLFPQCGENLGERMGCIFDDFFTRGYRNIVIVGSDLPVFPLRLLEEAFGALEKSDLDLVLGPSRDGGYYLIGMKRAAPGLFRDIPWGGSQVLSATTRRASGLGLKYHLLRSWFDIDTPEDLRTLASMSHPSLAQAQPRTLQWLEKRKAGSLFGE